MKPAFGSKQTGFYPQAIIILITDSLFHQNYNVDRFHVSHPVYDWDNHNWDFWIAWGWVWFKLGADDLMKQIKHCLKVGFYCSRNCKKYTIGRYRNSEWTIMRLKSNSSPLVLVDRSSQVPCILITEHYWKLRWKRIIAKKIIKFHS